MSDATPESLLKLDVHSVDRLLGLAVSPLSGPGIHPEVARALRAQAAECPRRSRFRIEITVPVEDLSREDEVRTAIHTHFEEEGAEAREELRELSHKGRWSFGIALIVVGLLVSISEAILLLGEARFITVLSESLIIVAWVTLWGPAETLLFARFPVRRQRNLAQALAASTVSLRAK